MKPFTTIAIIVFSLIALIHLLRLFLSWEATKSGMILPAWISVPGFLIASGLALMLWRGENLESKNNASTVDRAAIL